MKKNNTLVVLLFFFFCFSCAFSTSKKELFGCWISSNVIGTAYTNNLLLLTDNPQENSDGTYKMAYTTDKKIVKESLQTGTWKFESEYSSAYKGNINKITLTPSDKKKVPTTYELYFDGSVLKLIDRTAKEPTYQAFTMTEAFSEANFK